MGGVLPSDELTDEPSDFGSLRPGTRLGRYELLVPVARGGMARVWAARQHGQRGFQKLVAIKTILPHLAEEPEFERMFLDEARIASGVHHPNVCEIYELGEERHTLYLAMEWVSGDSLSRVLRASGKTEALDPRVVSRIIADACAGVHAAHELADEDGRQLGVVHRDMSPHNILLTMDGVAKVCDFGVAKALGQLHEQTSAGQLKGKIGYMSPEQVTGQPVDRRSDVFSLGCVVYEATTGERPFRGDNDFQVMQAILRNEIVPPSTLVRSYPPELEHIVMRALSAQPILRYPTAERMRFALEELLTKGQLVTQTNVAQVVRARIGELLERRRERIRQASGTELGASTGAWDPAGVPRSDPRDPRSGVKPASSPVRPPAPYLPKTLQMAAVTPRMGTPVAGAPIPTAAATAPTSIDEPAAAIDPDPPSLKTLALPPIEPATPALSRPPVSYPLLKTMPLGMPTMPATMPEPASTPPVSKAHRTAVTASHRPELPGHAADPPATRVGYFFAAFVGLVLAVLLGGGGFWLFTGRVWPHPRAPTPRPTGAPPPPVLSSSAAGPASVPPASVSAMTSAAPVADVDAGAPPRAHRPRPKEKEKEKEATPKEPLPKEPGLPDNPY